MDWMHWRMSCSYFFNSSVHYQSILNSLLAMKSAKRSCNSCQMRWTWHCWRLEQLKQEKKIRCTQQQSAHQCSHYILIWNVAVEFDVQHAHIFNNFSLLPLVSLFVVWLRFSYLSLFFPPIFLHVLCTYQFKCVYYIQSISMIESNSINIIPKTNFELVFCTYLFFLFFLFLLYCFFLLKALSLLDLFLEFFRYFKRFFEIFFHCCLMDWKRNCWGCVFLANISSSQQEGLKFLKVLLKLFFTHFFYLAVQI